MTRLGYPEVQEVLLDEVQFDGLVSDLESEARVVYVKTRGYPGRTRVVHGFEDAVAALRAGEIAGIQVVYAWDNRTWLDTLTRTTLGIRLVRVAH